MSFHKRFTRKRHKLRKEKKRVLIVGEGQKTEPYYFVALRKEEGVNNKFIVTVKPGPGFNQEMVVAEAIKQKNRAAARHEDFDEVYCVLDVEAADKREFLDKARRMAEGSNIVLCLSNPAFEVWFLLHFERRTRSHNDCNAVIEALNKHWRKQYKSDYDKGDASNYQRLLPHRDTALSNAESVMQHHQRLQPTACTADCNVSTDVHRLVKYLMVGGEYCT